MTIRVFRANTGSCGGCDAHVVLAISQSDDIELVASPVQFDERPARLRPAPEHGADTESILLETGRSWEDIATLRDEGAV